MKLSKIDIIAIVLLIYSIMLVLYLLFSYIAHSPEFLTHEQFATSLVAIYSSIFASFLALWIKITGKLTDFAQQFGEIKGEIREVLSQLKI